MRQSDIISTNYLTLKKASIHLLIAADKPASLTWTDFALQGLITTNVCWSASSLLTGLEPRKLCISFQPLFPELPAVLIKDIS